MQEAQSQNREMEEMKERILRHLQQLGSITTMEAVKEYGSLLLPHYIWILRHVDGLDIKDEWIHRTNRWGEKIKFKRYWLGGDK